METVKTSEDWYPIYREDYRTNRNQDIVIYDPDGWDRKNYQFSWHEELITYTEFEKRAFHSTVIAMKIKDNENTNKK